jgi:predicted transcriptional regulator
MSDGPGRKRETSDVEILKQISLHPEPVVTASEIAERVDMTNAGVNKRLKQLVNDGLVTRKQVGARAVIYWLSPAGELRAADE